MNTIPIYNYYQINSAQIELISKWNTQLKLWAHFKWKDLTKYLSRIWHRNLVDFYGKLDNICWKFSPWTYALDSYSNHSLIRFDTSLRFSDIGGVIRLNMIMIPQKILKRQIVIQVSSQLVNWVSEMMYLVTWKLSKVLFKTYFYTGWIYANRNWEYWGVYPYCSQIRTWSRTSPLSSVQWLCASELTCVDEHTRYVQVDSRLEAHSCSSI